MDMGFSPRALNGTHKPCAASAVMEHELSEIRILLERYAGVLLDGPADDLTARVTHYLGLRRLNSVAELLSLLRSSEQECESLLEALLQGESGFFRHPCGFDVLENKVVPELHACKSGETPRTLRIWSAGCSTGEEAYSIAISVCKAVECNGGGWNIHIVAGDIRRQALAIAQRGLYLQNALSALPARTIKEYFAKVGHHFLVKPRLRNLVTFTPMNLARPAYLGRFDCIFCMDVLPHFSATQRAALAERLHLYLEPGGYLFLGDAEKLPAVNVTFQAEGDTRSVYRKPLAAAAKSGK
jgi:chemotaxis methyl-accepting protein methylase